MPAKGKFKDLTGQVFGRLTVTGFASRVGRWSMWHCRCECGGTKTVHGGRLGRTTNSCGCLRRMSALARNRRDRAAGRGRVWSKLGEGRKWRYYRRNAMIRRVAWELSRAEFSSLITDTCDYCGACPLNGVDRVDNTVGYRLDNCVACCETCNRAKLQMTRSDFVAWVGRVHAHTGRLA